MKDKMTAAKRGRPRKEMIKEHQYRIRMNVGERAMLDHLSEKTGKNRADILRDALKMYYRNSGN